MEASVAHLEEEAGVAETLEAGDLAEGVATSAPQRAWWRLGSSSTPVKENWCASSRMRG